MSVSSKTCWPVPAGALLLAACAGSAAIYEFLPRERALRYEFAATNSNEIETPAGTQRMGGSPEATIMLSLGPGADSGTEFSATYESFRTGPEAPALGGITGSTFSGLVTNAGDVEIGEAPELDIDGITTDDLANIVTALFPPLPPGGADTSESWPHRVEGPVGARMEGTTLYEGVARFAGDTTWNGIPARKIVSEGTWTLTGTGTPAGAPAEIDMTGEGTGSTVYVWDPARGVLLGASAVTEGTGTVTTMGFEMPITSRATTSISLKLPDVMTSDGGDG